MHLQDSQVAVGPELRQIANAILNPGPRVKQAVAAVRDFRSFVTVQFDDLRVILAGARVKALPLASLALQGGCYGQWYIPPPSGQWRG
ncbi:MAG: hypothetical protein HC922_09945 [Leptolyngbyaceae cyanobacterium SM2_3_12]|nr:hypothetical protein [Leptolyngbyaceae cyanobacterium SM2_3_12]